MVARRKGPHALLGEHPPGFLPGVVGLVVVAFAALWAMASIAGDDGEGLGQATVLGIAGIVFAWYGSRIRRFVQVRMDG